MWQALAAKAIGGAMQVGGGLLAGHPDTIDWQPLTPSGEQKKAIQANTENLGANQELASKTNAFNQAELQKMLEKAIPGYSAIQQQSSDIIQAQLGGELTKDELNAMRRNWGLAGVLTGSGADSGFVKNRTLRDLGLQTIQRQQQGLSNAQSWLKSSASYAMPQLFDMTSMFLTPAQTFQMDYQNQMAAIGIGNYNNAMEWGSNWKTLLGKAISEEGQSLSNMGSFNMGSMFGGGGGGGGGIQNQVSNEGSWGAFH